MTSATNEPQSETTWAARIAVEVEFAAPSADAALVRLAEIAESVGDLDGVTLIDKQGYMAKRKAAP